ncbi:MAG: hypothetical protein II977_08060, partial [Oscillospiraceae bacterium]|nr:hypothetical protein [Oscillospiraceae bacterium]
MFYTTEEKRRIVDEYNRKRRKVKILRRRILLVFALCLPFIPIRSRSTIFTIVSSIDCTLGESGRGISDSVAVALVAD